MCSSSRAVGEHLLAALAHHDRGAGVLAHRQHPAGRDARVLAAGRGPRTGRSATPPGRPGSTAAGAGGRAAAGARCRAWRSRSAAVSALGVHLEKGAPCRLDGADAVRGQQPVRGVELPQRGQVGVAERAGRHRTPPRADCSGERGVEPNPAATRDVRSAADPGRRRLGERVDVRVDVRVDLVACTCGRRGTELDPSQPAVRQVVLGDVVPGRDPGPGLGAGQLAQHPLGDRGDHLGGLRVGLGHRRHPAQRAGGEHPRPAGMAVPGHVRGVRPAAAGHRGVGEHLQRSRRGDHRVHPVVLGPDHPGQPGARGQPQPGERPAARVADHEVAAGVGAGEHRTDQRGLRVRVRRATPVGGRVERGDRVVLTQLVVHQHPPGAQRGVGEPDPPVHRVGGQEGQVHPAVARSRQVRPHLT